MNLYPAFLAETGETATAWKTVSGAMVRLRVRKREKRLPDGSRPVVYSIPRQRRRGAQVVPIATARRA